MTTRDGAYFWELLEFGFAMAAEQEDPVCTFTLVTHVITMWDPAYGDKFMKAAVDAGCSILMRTEDPLYSQMYHGPKIGGASWTSLPGLPIPLLQAGLSGEQYGFMMMSYFTGTPLRFANPEPYDPPMLFNDVGSWILIRLLAVINWV